MSIIPVFLLLFFTSCASKQILPPTTNIIQNITHNISSHTVPANETTEQRWTREYLTGMYYFKKNNNEQACSWFSKLSKEDNFPLKALAMVKSLETCNYDYKILVNIWENRSNQIPPWIYEKFLEISIKHAQNNKLHRFTATFLFELSNFKKVQNEKIALLRKAIDNAKLADENNLVMQFSEKLHTLAPRYNPVITKDKIFETARDFERNRMFKKARILYHSIIQDDTFSFDTKLSAWNRIARTYKLARNNHLYLETVKKSNRYLQNMLNKNPDDDDLVKIFWKKKIQEARAVWTKHKPKKAQKILLTLLKKPSKDRNQVAMAYFILGNIAQESKERIEADEQYLQALEFEIPDIELMEKITWYRAWNLYLANKLNDSIDILDRLYDNTDNQSLKFKVRYWQGEAYAKLGRHDLARDCWEEVSGKNKYGYYGAISIIKLDGIFSPINPESHHPEEINTTLEWLLAMDEKNIAKDFLTFNKKYIDEYMDYMIYCHRSGAYDNAIYRFYSMATDERDELIEDTLSYIYPTPYENLIRQYSDKSKSYVVWSIIRQESAFNKNAKSPAHAYGLMQIIPEQAKKLSRRYKIPYKHFVDLYNPETNIKMGISLLNELLKKFNNNLVYSIASYNADINAVYEWIKKRKAPDLVHFIEMIPYAETQKYIKLVLRNFFIYKQIIEKSPFKITDDKFGLID